MKAATFGKLEKKFLEMSEFKGANESFLVFFFFLFFNTAFSCSSKNQNGEIFFF